MIGCLSGLNDLVAKLANMTPKCIEARAMKTMMIMFIAVES